MWQADKNRTRPITRSAAVASAAAAMAIMAFGSARACPPRYTAEMFDGPDCNPNNHSETAGSAINSSGQVVGNYRACGLANPKAFKWSSGPDITLLIFPLGTNYSEAFDIADDGAIVGHYEGGGGTGGFLRFNAAFIPLGAPDNGNNALPNGVNAAHVVVGTWGNSSIPGFGTHAFRWVDGQFQDITPTTGYGHAGAKCISENGLISGWAGISETGPGSVALIWNQDKVTVLPLPDNAYAATGFSVTDAGHVCGEAYFPYPIFPFNTKHGIVWTGGKLIDVGVLPGHDRSTLQSINASGQAVGFSGSYLTFEEKPIFWDGQVLHDMSVLDVGLASLTLTSARAINDSGQITGSVDLPTGGYVGVRLTPIPPNLGDTNCDAHVNVDDLLNVINGWGSCPNGAGCGADLNHDSLVGVEDLMIVLKSWDF